nr:pleiotropic drug resistance protein 2 [Tanacetum cinerariifolium]
MVGDQTRRGISGGEKKRVTTGKMLVGPANVFFMDEISTGLDSSTTFRITKFLKQMVHLMDLTMVISLLHPDPETYKLFDDIILMSQIVYQGPCENVLEFFELMGFWCPQRKGVADFLQEMTSRKDQEQYWFKEDQSYTYITITEFAKAFKSFHIGQELDKEMQIPYDKSKTHPDAPVKEKYGISNLQLLKACFEREWLTCYQSMEGSFLVPFFFGLLIVMFNGMAELALTVLRLPVFYKQRDLMLYPAWAFALPIWVLRIPLSLMESGIWVVLTYYTIGFAPNATRFGQQFLAFFAIHQMALSLFRLIAAVGRTEVLSNSLGALILFLVVNLGGFVVAMGTTFILLIKRSHLADLFSFTHY